VPSPVADAFANYRAFLGGQDTSVASERPVNGTIDRLAAAAGRILFTLRGHGEIYAIVDPGDPGQLLARSGDSVNFVSGTPSDGVSLVREFHDRSLGR
jgi:hypothetical protein